ncbi:GTP 3',8-cyclase MoaA [Rhodomicrobium lacus]|uniref:GTP 3',8-cyclase MoaA n=1 Tax=Rhodomicrobium lacus TaxID=2498452 RepID=UPI0026E3777B|nr:GTP 3',8-cyclase MoaA [Rhodomicrobium lacus]WKW49955.1 GTP 3',8-cyclase MoaA [Rhodomicrobium lacus]
MTLHLTEAATPTAPAMVDPFARHITYLRVSVTDRCDLRCVYCMPDRMQFAPKADLLTLEELDRLCSAFVAKGVRKIRLTGGEPLMRRGFVGLVRALSRHLATGALDEVTLTSNGTRMAEFAAPLRDAGVRRVNISLDTRDADKFRVLTRRGDLAAVLAGIRAARLAGLHVKINMVALKGINDSEIAEMLVWCHAEGMDLTLIETMPLGAIEGGRYESYLPLSDARARLSARFTLDPLTDRTGGPARYVRVRETGGRLGFITPLSHSFCESCNRVRVTATGKLYLCLGQEKSADLREPLRSEASDERLSEAIDAALALKPRGHDFIIDKADETRIARSMSVTGG